MKLQEAFKNLIKTKGPEIIQDLRLVNILDDYGCFRDTPGYKHILKSIISDGYALRLMSLLEWNECINQWAIELSRKKGYSKKLTKELFVFLSLSLGLCKIESELYQPEKEDLVFVFKPKCPSEEYEQLFRICLESQNAIAEGKKNGIDIRNITIKVKQYDVEYDVLHSYGYIYFSLELFRVKSLKRIRKLWVALYGEDENIIKKFSIGEMRNDDSMLKPCMRSTGAKLNEIKKIILFWG